MTFTLSTFWWGFINGGLAVLATLIIVAVSVGRKKK